MRVLASIAICLLGVGALACSDDPVVPAQAPAAPLAPTAPSAAADLLGAVDQDYRYDPSNKPDPFRSFVQVTMMDDTLATPLERFDLSQLTVAAIVWGTHRPRALVKDPAGKEYIVSEGTSIGKNQGRVVAIEDNLVRVKETYVDFRDQATTKEVEMRLHDTEGG